MLLSFDVFLRLLAAYQQVIQGGSILQLFLNPFRLPAAASPGLLGIIRVVVFRTDAAAPVFLRSHSLALAPILLPYFVQGDRKTRFTGELPEFLDPAGKPLLECLSDPRH